MDRTINPKDIEISDFEHKDIDEAQSFRDAPGPNYSEAEARKLIHKIDRRLLAICGSLVAVSLLDRSNLSNAYIAGSVYWGSACIRQGKLTLVEWAKSFS